MLRERLDASTSSLAGRFAASTAPTLAGVLRVESVDGPLSVAKNDRFVPIYIRKLGLQGDCYGTSISALENGGCFHSMGSADRSNASP